MWAWKWAFTDFRDFIECVKWWLIPNFASLCSGDYFRDAEHSVRLLLFLVICIGPVTLEYVIIKAILKAH
jgi:hypothetical protein